MTFMRSIILPLSAAIALVGNLAAPTFAFQIVPQITSRVAPLHAQNYRRSVSARFMTETSDESESDDSAKAEQTPVPPRPAPVRPRPVDPLVASLTRIDDPSPQNMPTANVPLFGEVPADGNLALLAPVAGIAVLGFLFSIVVAFNSSDALVRELSSVEIPEMKYTPTVLEEGKCRGLCSDQDTDLEGLRGFMESLRKE